jgi:soluble cytochrome b562
MPNSLRALAAELKPLEALREKYLGLIDVATQAGDLGEVARLNVLVVEVEAQINQIKDATIDDPKVLEDIRKGFQALLGAAVKQGAQDTEVLRVSIKEVDAQIARLWQAARAHDPSRANTASL